MYWLYSLTASGQSTFLMEPYFCFLLADVESLSPFVCRIVMFLLFSVAYTFPLLLSYMVVISFRRPFCLLLLFSRRTYHYATVAGTVLEAWKKKISKFSDQVLLLLQDCTSSQVYLCDNAVSASLDLKVIYVPTVRVNPDQHFDALFIGLRSIYCLNPSQLENPIMASSIETYCGDDTPLQMFSSTLPIRDTQSQFVMARIVSTRIVVVSTTWKYLWSISNFVLLNFCSMQNGWNNFCFNQYMFWAGAGKIPMTIVTSKYALISSPVVGYGMAAIDLSVHAWV